MKLRLSDSAPVWALMHPSGYFYVGGQTNSGTYNQSSVQKTQIILTDEEPESDEIVFEELPRWAQNQIKTSLRAGLILKVEKKVEVAHANVVRPDYGVLSDTVTTIKKKVKDEPLDKFLELLVKEKQGLNSTGKPRAGLIAFFEEEIENRTK